MDEELRDVEVALEVPRKAPTLDFGVLLKAETDAAGAHWTRRTRKTAYGGSHGCMLVQRRDAKMEPSGFMPGTAKLCSSVSPTTCTATSGSAHSVAVSTEPGATAIYALRPEVE